MTVGQQSQQKTIHQILLPDHNVTDLLPERWNPLAQLSYFLRNFLRRFHTVCSDILAARMFDQNKINCQPATYCFRRAFELRDCADPF
jgi:hypothetical protein